MGTTRNFLSVLIVDDNPVVRADLHTLLSLFDGVHEIQETYDLRSTMNAALSQEPDLILLDLQLSNKEETDLDGLQIIRNIKQRFPACLVFVLTVHGYPSAKSKAMQAGADKFYIKGQDEQLLFESIKMTIRSINEKKE